MSAVTVQNTYGCRRAFSCGEVRSIGSNNFTMSNAGLIVSGRIRHGDSNLDLPLLKTTTEQITFTYRIASIWNNLSENLKQSASLNIFKQRLREQLLTIN